MKEIGLSLVIDPGICHGQMTFRGTRIPVDTVLSYLARGYSVEQLVQSWPELTVDAVKEAVILAADSLQNRYPTNTVRMPVMRNKDENQTTGPHRPQGERDLPGHHDLWQSGR